MKKDAMKYYVKRVAELEASLATANDNAQEIRAGNQERIAKLEAERDGLQAERNLYYQDAFNKTEEARELVWARARLRTEVERLREALGLYGRHQNSCGQCPPLDKFKFSECTCGLSEALDDQQEAKAHEIETPTERCPLQEGREHLTEAGEFRSDKYPDTPDGMLPLKFKDPTAWKPIRDYADAREPKDPEFTRDVHEALDNAGAPDGPNQPTTAPLMSSCGVCGGSGKIYIG